MTATRTPAQAAADRMIADRGPLPDHLVRSIAKRLAKAQPAPRTQAPAVPA